MDNQLRSNFLYPPGGILIWIIVFLELTVFFALLIVMKNSSHTEMDVFRHSVADLNIIAGTANTVILLLSGYFMAKTITVIDHEDNKKHKSYLLATIICGLIFIAIKMVEYSEKLSSGMTISYNAFFTFYWLITMFHLLHVVFGITILTYFYFQKALKDRYQYQENLEAGAVFWHMCDLIWVVVFAVIYLYWR
ncbi:MAG: cytochrome c oxidase subunit 3 [Saprospiraceae bacterium]|nr:cytochrome c oxidase subunit 3 [Saprospiraceae bacterium]